MNDERTEIHSLHDGKIVFFVKNGNFSSAQTKKTHSTRKNPPQKIKNGLFHHFHLIFSPPL